MTVGPNYDDDEVIADDLPPIARATDPQTSHDAAEAISGSGRRLAQKQECLNALWKRPGMTYGEVGDVTGIAQCWRRLSDLKNDGLIYASGSREYHGRAQTCWWPIIDGQRDDTGEEEDTHVCKQPAECRVVRIASEWLVQRRGRAPIGISYCPWCGQRLDRTGPERTAQPRLAL